MFQAYIKKHYLKSVCLLILSSFLYPVLGTLTEQLPPTHNRIWVTPEEGKQYQKVSAKVLLSKEVQALIAKDPGKIQVIEFFSYACFWCQRLHPVINEWLKIKPSSVVFYRFPLIFNKNWEPLAKAYFINKALGKSDALDEAFFYAIHQNRKDLSDDKILRQFYVENGVSENQYSDLLNSFSINQEVKFAHDISNAYQITASPVIIINAPSGSYIFTAAMAGSESAFKEVLDYLVNKQLKK